MIEQPRTLLISPYFDAATPSGGVLYSLDVVREWLRQGRQVAVLCSSANRSLGDLADHLDSGQLTLHSILSPDQIRFTHHLHQDVGFVAEQVIRLFRPEVIHVHNTQGMLSAVLAATSSPSPVILTALDFGLICFNFYLRAETQVPCEGLRPPGECARCIGRGLTGAGGRLGRILPRAMTRRIWPNFVRLDQIKSVCELQDAMRHVMLTSSAIIAPSPVMARKMREFAGPATEVRELVYGVSAGKVLRPVKESGGCLRLAHLGGADPIKGMSVLAEATAMLDDNLAMNITCYGGETVRSAVEATSPGARRYLSYHPAIFGTELAAEHARIDAVLVPSLWHENSPFVVIESLANGTPVIASDADGIRHLIEPGRTGLLLPSGNAHAWAEALASAARAPEVIHAMQSECSYTRTTADFVRDVGTLEASLLSPCEAAGLEP